MICLDGKFAGDELGDDVKVGAVAEQPGCGRQIFRARGGMEKTAGVLVNAESHQGRFVRAGCDIPLLKQLHKKGGGGAEGANHLELAVEVLRPVGMMVVEVDCEMRIVEAPGQLAEAVRLAGVDHDQPSDAGRVNMFDFFELVDIAEFLGQVVADAFFLGSGKDQLRLRIEPFGGNHGGETVEICANVCGDDVHGFNYTQKRWGVKPGKRGWRVEIGDSQPIDRRGKWSLAGLPVRDVCGNCLSIILLLLDNY